jgi:hypothetical protein
VKKDILGLWSKDEIKRLKRLFPVLPTSQLLVHFPKRSKSGINDKAQELGLRKNYVAKKWWSTEEEQYLARHYHNMGSEQIAAVLGTTKRAVQAKAERLKIARPNNRWAPEDVETLRKLSEQGKTSRELAEAIGRNKRAVDQELARQRRDFGLPRKLKRWSEEEKEYLRQRYHDTSVDQIAATFGRTASMIHGMAQRLKLIRRKRWTAGDIDLLKQHYHTLPNAQIAKMLNRTPQAVQLKAWGLGLARRARSAEP